MLTFFSLALVLPLTLALPFDFAFFPNHADDIWGYDRPHHQYTPFPSYTLTSTGTEAAVGIFPTAVLIASASAASGTANPTDTYYPTGTSLPASSGIVKRQFQPSQGFPAAVSFPTAFSFPTGFALPTGTAVGATGFPSRPTAAAGLNAAAAGDSLQRFEGPRKLAARYHYPYQPVSNNAAAATASELPTAAPTAVFPTASAASAAPFPTVAR